MRLSWFFWWLVNIMWIVVFGISVKFLLSRDPDFTQGTGTKAASIGLLLFTLLLPLILQGVWYIVNVSIKEKRLEEEARRLQEES